ncbi:sigma-70 family RNA polymerase sigma factor [Streptomyces bacillaris]|uniref:sigma-70 family RNA polymerase sigma factor n=1 Tax=Streptomyces bacillaris TaxID=68179 RepID=UPI003460D056
MVMVAERQARRLRASLGEEIEDLEREDNACGPEAEPVAAAVRVAGVSRPADAALRVLLDSWFREYAPMVRRVVARAVRREDVDLVDDLAQDVWVEAWQYLLRGNTVTRPAGLLAVMARSRVCGHYRLARVRRETLTDFQVTELAVDRLVSWIGAAA